MMTEDDDSPYTTISGLCDRLAGIYVIATSELDDAAKVLRIAELSGGFLPEGEAAATEFVREQESRLILPGDPRWP